MIFGFSNCYRPHFKGFHSQTTVIANIQDMMNWEVILAHSREENFSAYFLTKLGLTNNDRLIIWESPPKIFEEHSPC
jgi:hypothetical protein